METPTTSGKENYYGPEDKFYRYRVTLWLTNSSIKIHFIGNGPSTLRFDYETASIPEMYTSATDEYTDSYWQRIEVPRGIRAKTHSGASYTDTNGQTVKDGDYIDVYGRKITNGQGYVVADETVEALSNIRLIRNFCQVSVESLAPSISNFELKSYSIVNEPMQGTVAPYNGAWFDYLSFVDSGGTHAYDDLYGIYQGSEYASTTYDSSYPEASAFTSTPPGADVIPAGGVGYVYERPAPKQNQPPTYLLVYGIYHKTGDVHDGDPCYYKIDLMEKGVYLTLFRNFRYRVTIKHVNKFGKPTPKSAAEGAGSGDVSADAEAVSLTDISDGDCQLYVSEMRPILVEEYQNFSYTGLSYKFVYNVSTSGGALTGDDAVDNNYYASDQANTIAGQSNTGDHGGAGKPITMSFYRVVGNTVIPFDTYEHGGGDVIDQFKLDTLPQPAESNYFRNIYFTTKPPTGATRTETFRIKAVYTSGSGETERTHTLYRDIIFTLLKTQQLSVRCIPDDVIQEAGQKVTVRISIPTGLPQAMFPLQFPIEIANRSLGPDYDYTAQNLPVTYGQTYQYTEQDGNKVRGTQNGYYFVRSLSLEEYNSSLNPETGNVEFDTYFITTKDQSASEVFVGCFPPADKQYSYFESSKTSFSDYELCNFTWVTDYSSATFWTTGTDKQLQFRLDTSDIPLDQNGNPDVYVTLTSNLSPAETSSNLSGTATPNRYKIDNVGTGGLVTIRVHVADVGVGYPVKVTLSARHYNTNELCQGVTFAIIEVTGITVSPSSATMNIGGTQNLTANVMPLDATDRSVTWTSLNPSVATVSSTGVVTAVSLGTATIRATANDGSGKYGSCTINVVPVAVTGVSLNNTSLRMVVGDADVTLTATVTPANAANKNVSWSSSNTSVATVDANGKVHAVGTGTTVITVTTEDGGYTATCNVRVYKRKTVTINTNNSNGSFGNNNTLTSQGIRLDITNVDTRNANYIEMGYRSGGVFGFGGQNNNGTIAVSSTTITDFAIEGVTFNYNGNNNNYAQGNVTSNQTGTYTRDNRVGTWTPSATPSSVTFTMEPRQQGLNTYYWNRLSSIGITYLYSD